MCLQKYSKQHAKGLTLLETILVVTIIFVTMVLVLPNLNKSKENKQAKAALQTIEYIAQAVTINWIKSGVDPDLTLSDLENTGAVDPKYYAPDYTYSLAPTPSFHVHAVGSNSRTIDFFLDTGAVDDSGGYLADLPGYALGPPPFFAASSNAPWSGTFTKLKK